MLYEKLATLPENLKRQVANFIDSLLQKEKESGISKKPKFGSGRGMFKIKPDFNEPLDDFKEYIR